MTVKDLKWQGWELGFFFILSTFLAVSAALVGNWWAVAGYAPAAVILYCRMYRVGKKIEAIYKEETEQWEK